MPRDSTIDMRSHVSIGSASSAGVKPVNQDAHAALVPNGRERRLKGVVTAIADGISTSPVGGEAARIAVTSFLDDYAATPDSWSARTALTRVLEGLNGWLYARNVSVDDLNAGHVCTFAGLVIKGGEAHLIHLGDSRIWRLSGTTLEPLTEDHRMTLAAGEHRLSRALGAEPRAEPSYRRLPVAAGDVFVLTTDGVHDYLPPRTLAAELTGDLDTAAHSIVAASLSAGSTDNLTVLIVRIDRLLDDAPGPPSADLPLQNPLTSGDLVDGVTILREVHASDRSRLYLARAPDGRRVALKLPTAEMVASPADRQRFAMEDWTLRRVASPHVVAAMSPPERRSALYLATSWVEGRTLRQWLDDRGTPSLDEVRAVAAQIATGLRALHRREILHQDLRPENVMIDADGTVTLIDLGSASALGVEEAAPGLLGPQPGTLQYTAPEYLSGDAVSWRSDQFALAVIVYEMLTGTLPYGAEVARIRGRADQRRLRYRPARNEARGVPDWMDDALRRALHPDPVRRFDALSEFVAALATPPPASVRARHRPLMERDPLRFWQCLSAALAVACLVLLTR